MSSETKEINKILDSQQDCLRSIRDNIVIAVREGLRKGGSKGAKRGAWDGLKEECLPQGLLNVEGVPTNKDIVVAISRMLTKAKLTRSVGPAIKSMVGTYLDLVAAAVRKIPQRRKPRTEDIVQLVIRKYEVKDWMEEKLPKNPVTKSIAAGISTALQKALTDSIETFKVKVDRAKGSDLKDAGKRLANQERDEKLVHMRSTVRDAVAAVAEELAYITAKQITKRVIVNLKKKLRQKQIHRLEELLRKTSDKEFRKGLDKAANRFGDKLVNDCADETSLVNAIEQGFEKGFEKYLSSLVKWLTPLKLTGITCACLAVGGGVAYAMLNSPPVINDVISNPSTVYPGETSVITCIASDPDDDRLSYSWEATDGIISGDGNEITWTAPPTPGNNVIWVSVDDGKGDTVTGGCTIIVLSRPAVLAHSPSLLHFDLVPEGHMGSDTFQVWNSGGGTLSYNLSEESSWFWLSPTSGTSIGEYDTINIYIDTSGLPGGSYSDTISISSNGGTGSIPVSVGVESSPILDHSPSSLNLGTVPENYSSSITFQVWNSGGGTLSYSLSEESSWFWLSTTSGESTGEHDTVTVYIDTSGLPVGSYSDIIFVSSSGGKSSIPVSMNIESSPVLAYSPSSLNFGLVPEDYTGSKTFQVWNSGGGTLSYNLSEGVDWLWLSSTSGESTGEYNTITVYIDTTGLPEGEPYSAIIFISSNGGTGSIPVSMNIESPPIIACPPSLLNFGSVLEGYTGSKTFQVCNSGGGTLSYSLSEGASWLWLSPTSGTSTGEYDTITVYIDTEGLSDGLYSDTISILSNGGTCNVLVSVDVESPPVLAYYPSLLYFIVEEGYTSSSTFEVWNSGVGTLSYSLSEGATWLQLSTTSGISTVEHDIITVNVNASGLPDGSYPATISISSNGGTGSVSVSMNVVSFPELGCTISSIDFGMVGDDYTGSKTFYVWNKGSGTLSYSLGEGATWLELSSTSGTSTGLMVPITVYIDTTGLPDNTYSAVISIWSNGGTWDILVSVWVVTID